MAYYASHFMCPQNLTNEMGLLQILTAFSRFLKVHALIPKDFATYLQISPLATLLFASSIFLIIILAFDPFSPYISPFFCCVTSQTYYKFKKTEDNHRIINWAINSKHILLASYCLHALGLHTLHYQDHQ